VADAVVGVLLHRREVAIDLAIMWVTPGVARFVFSVDPMKLPLHTFLPGA
jgi:hypothetical protein